MIGDRDEDQQAAEAARVHFMWADKLISGGRDFQREYNKPKSRPKN